MIVDFYIYLDGPYNRALIHHTDRQHRNHGEVRSANRQESHSIVHNLRQQARHF